MLGPLRLLVDSASRGGSPEPTVTALREALASHEPAPEVEVVPTTAGAIATAVAESLAADRRYLVVVGGDDSVHALVNALPPGQEDVVVGMVPTGPRCDLARTFGLDRRPDVLARHLVTDTTIAIDVGVVEYRTTAGERAERRFANVAQVGYGADAVRREARLPRRLGRFGALAAAYGAIRGVPRQEAKVALAHATVAVPLVNLIAANGQFYAQGAKIAPRALPDDGILNVQLFTGARSQVFLLTSRIFRGEHLPDPDIREYQSPTVEVAPPIPLAVEADGQYLGTTPATFRLLHQALRLKI